MESRFSGTAERFISGQELTDLVMLSFTGFLTEGKEGTAKSFASLVTVLHSHGSKNSGSLKLEEPELGTRKAALSCQISAAELPWLHRSLSCLHLFNLPFDLLYTLCWVLNK